MIHVIHITQDYPKLLFRINKSLQLEICKIILLKSSFPFYFNNYYYNIYFIAIIFIKTLNIIGFPKLENS